MVVAKDPYTIWTDIESAEFTIQAIGYQRGFFEKTAESLLAVLPCIGSA